MICTNCGVEIGDTATICSACGAAVTPPVQEPILTATPEDIEANKLMAVLAYLGILVLVPILAVKDSPFAKFHANQGLVLLIASVICYFVGTLLSFILIGFLLFIPPVVFTIIGIVNAVGGQMKELPLIGKFKILK